MGAPKELRRQRRGAWGEEGRTTRRWYTWPGSWPVEPAGTRCPLQPLFLTKDSYGPPFIRFLSVNTSPPAEREEGSSGRGQRQNSQLPFWWLFGFNSFHAASRWFIPQTSLMYENMIKNSMRLSLLWRQTGSSPGGVSNLRVVWFLKVFFAGEKSSNYLRWWILWWVMRWSLFVCTSISNLDLNPAILVPNLTQLKHNLISLWTVTVGKYDK